MQIRSLFVVLFIVALLSGAVLAGASPASASDVEPSDDCPYPFVHVHEEPGVGWDGSIGGTVTVEPGEYHLHCLP